MALSKFNKMINKDNLIMHSYIKWRINFYKGKFKKLINKFWLKLNRIAFLISEYFIKLSQV